MGAESKIQWTDATFNPWIGCAHVSEGCRNCYAEVQTFARVQRGRGRELWGPIADRHRTSVANWAEVTRWNRDAEKEGVRRRVFCASLCDVFEDRRDLDAWRTDLAWLVASTPGLDWQFLTKRIDRAADLWEEAWADGTRGHARHDEGPWLKSIWLGCTVEERKALPRIAHLRAVPAGIRFLSVEPQIESLGAVDLGGIDWMIIGGESGPNARPFDLAWARDLIGQCREQGVRPFFKQAGAHPIPEKGHGRPDDMTGRRVRMWVSGLAQRLVLDLRNPKGGDLDELPPDLGVREFPAVRP